MAAKVVNNAVAHAEMVILVEAAALAAAEGIALEDLCELLEQDDAGVKRPLSGRLAGRVRERRYDGGMPTEAARKDSALALDMARAGGVPLFCMQAADSVYELALRAGLGRRDYASIATLWEAS
jgi:3-hydroxyisobutyrate dehydrogenase-like beta-hydroxyacid dehydrogenase